MSQEESLDSSRHYFHYLEAFSGSFALIAPGERATRAVVFVHGFGGDACRTWSNFQLLVDDLEAFSSWFSASDLFFFQYKSVWHRIDTSVQSLLDFVDAIIPEPEDKHFTVALNPVLPEEEADPVLLSVFAHHRNYEEVILVGHSEGGVIIRQAILNADSDTRRDRRSLLGSRLALFAPALFGYSPSGFLGTLANFPGVGQVVNALFSATPAYQDLKDVKGLLEPLQTDTEDLAEKKSYPACLSYILWSSEDHIVKPGRFGKYRTDPIREYVEGQSHTTICKPSTHYTDPIKVIVSLKELLG